MRQYGPVAVVLASLMLLGFTVYTRFLVPSSTLVLQIDPALVEQLGTGEASIVLMSTDGTSIPAVSWQVRSPNKLVVEKVEGPLDREGYAFMLVYWPTGQTTLHPVTVRS